MSRLVLIAFLVMILGQQLGCAKREATLTQWRTKVVDTIPRCTDCTTKWKRAEVWVREHCKPAMKQVTDNLIETINASGTSRACRVRKSPVEGDYTIDLEIWCNSSFMCGESSVLTNRQRFNDYVNEVEISKNNTQDFSEKISPPPETENDNGNNVEIKSNDRTSLPNDIKMKIRSKCANDFPGDYSKQASCVREQEAAWGEINQ